MKNLISEKIAVHTVTLCVLLRDEKYSEERPASATAGQTDCQPTGASLSSSLRLCLTVWFCLSVFSCILQLAMASDG